MTTRGRYWGTVFLAFPAAFALSAAPGVAQKIEDFERSATEEGRDRGDHSSADSDYDEDQAEGALAALLLGIVLPVYGASQSWARIAGGSGLADQPPEPRWAGEATIPFVRVDAAYQPVESDVDAWDLRGELGFGPFAIQGRETHYEEDEPPDDLDLVQAHALLRMTFIEMLEVDLGIGGLVLSGDDTSSGLSGTVPILVHPWDFLGLEFRPVWADVNDNVVEDYDLSLLGGWRFVSARIGYRWTSSGRSSLNGPIFGLAARW